MLTRTMRTPSRRQFIKRSSAMATVAACLGPKPLTQASTSTSNEAGLDFFFDQQKELLERVQLILLPQDGDGPSAADINALNYLDWALNEPDNKADGDRNFIVKGIDWLSDLTQTTYGVGFLSLSLEQQQNLIAQIAETKAGENWLSLLIYYLMEALLLDPVYGGNPKGIGWQWLEHQPGFPRPTPSRTYQTFY